MKNHIETHDLIIDRPDITASPMLFSFARDGFKNILRYLGIQEDMKATYLNCHIAFPSRQIGLLIHTLSNKILESSFISAFEQQMSDQKRFFEAISNEIFQLSKQNNVDIRDLENNYQRWRTVASNYFMLHVLLNFIHELMVKQLRSRIEQVIGVSNEEVGKILLTYFEGNRNISLATKSNLALYDIFCEIRSNPTAWIKYKTLPCLEFYRACLQDLPIITNKISAFIDDYGALGARDPVEEYLESPPAVLQSIHENFDGTTEDLNVRVWSTQSTKKEISNTLIEQIYKKLSFHEKTELANLLETYARTLSKRSNEDDHLFWCKGARKVRLLLLKIGYILQLKGIFEIPDDIFFLFPEEIHKLINSNETKSIRDAISNRRKDYRRVVSLLE